MIEITKEEAKVIRKKYPHAAISKTVNKRYLEETEKYLRMIPNNSSAAQILADIDRKRGFAID